MLRLIGGYALAGLLLATVAPLHAQMPSSDAANYAARAVTLTGSVSVLKDNQPWALSIGDSIQVKAVVVSGPDGHAVFQVSDGSTFEVFPNSYVVFRKNPPNWKDLIDVIIGRVKVHIEHFGNQPNPNRVLTPTAVISVRGTTFDVSVDPDSESTLVDVVEGEVVVQHALIGGASKTLHTGESFTVYRTVPLVARGMDRDTIINRTVGALKDALQTLATRGPRTGTGIPAGGGTVGGSTGGSTGDTGKPAPPPSGPPE